jgi:polyhydroxyalkanoate synthesis regulator phasin
MGQDFLLAFAELFPLSVSQLGERTSSGVRQIFHIGGEVMEIIRKAMLFGIGVISLTKDKAEEVVDDLIRRGEVASGDRFRAIETLLKEADRQQEEFTRKIAGSIQKVVTEMGLPTRRELDEISAQLREIDSKLSALLLQKEKQ